MGQTFTIFPINIFERGTMTVSGVTDDAYPAARLYDRSTSFFWKATATEAKTFKVDQGADILPVDILAIGLNNFAGVGMQWQNSDDGADWADAVTDWTPSASAPFIKTLSASVTKKWWQVTLASMANPRCSEIFMGPGYTFSIQKSPKPYAVSVANVQWNRTVGGMERSTKFGISRRSRSYSVFLDEVQLSEFEAALDFLDDLSKPFFFKDHTGEYYWARLAEEPYFDFDHKTHTHITLKFIEML